MFKTLLVTLALVAACNANYVGVPYRAGVSGSIGVPVRVEIIPSGYPVITQADLVNSIGPYGEVPQLLRLAESLPQPKGPLVGQNIAYQVANNAYQIPNNAYQVPNKAY